MKNGTIQILTGGGWHWQLDGQYHRTDGPSVGNATGDLYWHIHGKLHRTDGPAVQWKNGYKGWYLNGEWYGNGDEPSIDFLLAALVYEGMSE